jgi:Pectate lyase superfamily protein
MRKFLNGLEAVGGFIKGAIQDKGGQVFNVRAYGAVGDGTTDDATAIKAAMDAAHAAGGGEVLLMPGIHAIGSSMTNSYKNVMVRGYPGLTTLKATASFTNGIINLDAASSFVSNIYFKDIIFDCNNQTSVMAVSIKGGTYSAGAYADNIQFKNCYYKNYAPTSDGLVTIYTGRGSTDRGPVTNVKFWGCDFGATNKYHVNINGCQLETIHFFFTKFHDGVTPVSFGFNQPSQRDQVNNHGRSNKDALFSYCKWYSQNTGQTAGYMIHDTARTGWRDMVFDHCEVEGHGIDFSADPIPINQEGFCGVMSVHRLVFNYCNFRNNKTCFSLGASNNNPYYENDPTIGLWVTNCNFWRCFNFADNDSNFFAMITDNFFYEVYNGGIALGYSNHNPTIFARNYIYNCIDPALIDPAPSTISGYNSALTVDSDGFHIFDNIIRDDRLLTDPSVAPVLTSASATGAAGGTFYFAYSYENDTGETILSPVSNTTVSANQTVKVTHPTGNNGPYPGVKKVNFYGGTSAGSLTLQNYMPMPIHLDYETDHYTTFKEPYWQMPTAGLVAGAASPVSNTTHAVMKNGIHDSTSTKLGSGVKMYNNHFYGILNELDLYNPIAHYNNWTNRTLAPGADQLVEAIPYAKGNITGAITFNIQNGAVQTATFTGNVTATLSGGHYVGQTMERRFTMGSSGSYTYTKASNEKLAGGNFTPSASVGSIDILIQEWDGTDWVERRRTMGVS